MKPSREQIELAALAGAGLIGGVWKYVVRPELTAKRGWMAIGAGVVAYELACPAGETLSEGVDRGLDKHRLALTAGTLLLTGHLLNAFGKYDPLHQAVEFARHFRDY